MPTPTLADRLKPRNRPEADPVMYQDWRSLLFLHWEWDAAAIQRTLPRGLTVDTFEGKAYLGVVPFFMRNIRPRFCPTVPGISNFLELNVRTYVYDQRGVPGVWFYSLDANQWLAVKVARLFFGLPYFHAVMQARLDRAGNIVYDLRRLQRPEIVRTRFIYRGEGQAKPAETGTLPFFLLERYILFSHDPHTEQLSTGQVYHTPYPVSQAVLSEWDDLVLEMDGFPRPNRDPDHVAFSPGVSVEIFPLQTIR